MRAIRKAAPGWSGRWQRTTARRRETRCREAADGSPPSRTQTARRNLVDTALTHGEPLVVVVGLPKAPAIAVRGRAGAAAMAKLAQWLGDESEAVQGPAADMVG